jgi:hypothetical protein
VPKGWENGRVDSGTGKHPRYVIEANIPEAVRMLREGASWEDIGDSFNKVVGEYQAPEGDGNVIVESEDVFGLPLETRDIPYPHKGFYAHFWLDSGPRKDKISGHHDVAVRRGCGWHRDEDERCLDIDAVWGRWGAGSGGGFHPVRGPVPEVRAELEK